jgi:hypothetical protein
VSDSGWRNATPKPEVDEIDLSEWLYCEGCAELMSPEFARFDIEGVPLCPDCWGAAPLADEVPL